MSQSIDHAQRAAHVAEGIELLPHQQIIDAIAASMREVERVTLVPVIELIQIMEALQPQLIGCDRRQDLAYKKALKDVRELCARAQAKGLEDDSHA